MNDIKTVKISDKGQISIPKDIRENMKLKQGETLILLSDGNRIVLEKTDRIARNLKDNEGKKTMIMSEQTLKKDWDNDYDERWNRC
ncbi:MAG: AbrB/MazE/SpoVT family DNA-binding domain-containing protein [Candidatus Aenigmarchaeota archaeon]|nr:AbrB/MazE/SpoVT family DNA-binding domain-containing protein [Candidatus Aenigmarchaeota archaeon]